MKEICHGLQSPEGPITMADGSVVLVEIERCSLSRVSADGRISVIAGCGSGPNGAAIGPVKLRNALRSPAKGQPVFRQKFVSWMTIDASTA